MARGGKAKPLPARRHAPRMSQLLRPSSASSYMPGGTASPAARRQQQLWLKQLPLAALRPVPSVGRRRRQQEASSWRSALAGKNVRVSSAVIGARLRGVAQRGSPAVEAANTTSAKTARRAACAPRRRMVLPLLIAQSREGRPLGAGVLAGLARQGPTASAVSLAARQGPRHRRRAPWFGTCRLAGAHPKRACQQGAGGMPRPRAAAWLRRFGRTARARAKLNSLLKAACQGWQVI